MVADNNAVIIGAMVVAPWILQLRVAVFAILIGQARLLSRSLITLVAGAGITLILSMGLMLSGPDIRNAQGPALLYAANLLGILIDGITVLAIREPYFRDKLRRRRRSRLPVLLALGLAVLVGKKLYGRYEQYPYRHNREVAQKQIESEIRYYLKNETLTFGANDAVELEKVVFDWPDY